MKTSSARQLEFELPRTESAFEDTPITLEDARSASDNMEADGTSTAPRFDVPRFGDYNEAYAITARMAGRLNAASVSEAEHKELLAERQRLLDKKLDGTITRKESNRLEYVRWSLDRIDDAKYGEALDRLESYVEQYERFSADVQMLQEQLMSLKKGRR